MCQLEQVWMSGLEDEGMLETGEVQCCEHQGIAELEVVLEDGVEQLYRILEDGGVPHLGEGIIELIIHMFKSFAGLWDYPIEEERSEDI